MSARLFLAAIITFVTPWRDGASPSATAPAASEAAPAPPAGGDRVDAAVYREVAGGLGGRCHTFQIVDQLVERVTPHRSHDRTDRHHQALAAPRFA
jgi:hypothetical protein